MRCNHSMITRRLNDAIYEPRGNSHAARQFGRKLRPCVGPVGVLHVAYNETVFVFLYFRTRNPPQFLDNILLHTVVVRTPSIPSETIVRLRETVKTNVIQLENLLNVSRTVSKIVRYKRRAYSACPARLVGRRSRIVADMTCSLFSDDYIRCYWLESYHSLNVKNEQQKGPAGSFAWKTYRNAYSRHVMTTATRRRRRRRVRDDDAHSACVFRVSRVFARRLSSHLHDVRFARQKISCTV